MTKQGRHLAISEVKRKCHWVYALTAVVIGIYVNSITNQMEEPNNLKGRLIRIEHY